MTGATLFGGLGTLVGLVRALPQLVRLVRTRDAHGVSIDSTAASAAISFGWATYGLWTDQLPVTLATTSSGLVFVLITLLAIRHGRRPTELKAASVWVVVLIVTGWLGGSAGLGVLLPVSVLVGNLPQVVTTYRERDLSGLSASTWTLSVADGLVWGGYSLITGDIAIGVFGVLQTVSSFAIVERRLAWWPRLDTRQEIQA